MERSRVQHLGDGGHDLLQERPELNLGGDVRDHVQELGLLLTRPRHPLDHQAVLQHHRGLHGHGLQQGQIVLGEAVVDLVETLHHAECLAAHRPDRGREDVSGGESGNLVHLAAEARVGAGVVDDEADAGREDVAGDAIGIEDPELPSELALPNPRAELARVGIVQKQRAPFGTDRFRRNLDQGIELLVQGLDRCDPVGNG